MAHAYRAMVRRPGCVPGIHKACCAQRKTIAAVGISYLQNRPRNGLTFCDDESELMLSVLGK